jgi:hypothetical protein
MCYLFRSNVFENVIPGQVRYANLYQGNKSWDDKDLISLRLERKSTRLNSINLVEIRIPKKFSVCSYRMKNRQKISSES